MMKVAVGIALTLSVCCLWMAQPTQAEESSRPQDEENSRPQAEENLRPITAWPLIYHRADKGSAETDVFWPLFHYEREDERISYALRPFLFSTESDPKEDSRKTSILWPFTGYSRKKSGTSLYIFPVYWYGKSLGKYDKQYNIIFPFYWDGKGRDYSYFHVWPLFGVNRRWPAGFRHQEPEHQEAVHQEPEHQEAVHQEPEHQEAAHQEPEHQEAGHQEAVHQEPEHQEAAHQKPEHQGAEDQKPGHSVPGDTEYSGYTEYSTIYPFFQYGYDTQSDRLDIDAPWPIIGVHHKGDYSSHRFLPFYWSEKGSDYTGGFIFPYYWRNTPTCRAKGAFPLWYTSRGQKSETDLFFPLYFNRKTPQERLRLITPFFVNRQWIDKQQHSNHLKLLIPFYFDYEDERGDLRFITPLYVSNRTKESRLSTFIPLYLNYEGSDMGLKVILPSYAHYRSGTFTSLSLFPVYYHSMDTQLQSELTYYFPLYGEYRRGDVVSRHFIFFPLFSKSEDSELQLKTWDVVWPFFHYEKSPTTSSARALPFFWQTRSADSGMTIGFPVYWSFKHGENTYTHLVPFYGVHRKGNWYKKRFVLGPLFMDTEDSSNGLSRQDILFPLYSSLQEQESDKSDKIDKGVKSNKGYRGNKGRTWFLPFFYHRHEYRHGYRHEHRHEANERLTLGSLALLPPYYINWKKGDESDDGSRNKGKDDESLSGDESLLGDEASSGYEASFHEKELFHIWPFYGKMQKGSYREYSTLWPLFRIGNDPKRDAQLIHLLLYYRKAEKEAENKRVLSTVFPFWWHGETAQATHDVSPLLHWYENDKKKDKKAVAFFWLYPPEISLIKYQQQPGRMRNAVFPLYSYDHNESKDSLRWTFLWPLFSFSSRGGDDFSRQTGFLWKVISYEQKGEKNRDFRFLWRLIRSNKTDKSYTFEFNPLYYYESGIEGESYWAILGGLLGVETKKNQRKKVRLFWIFG